MRVLVVEDSRRLAGIIKRGLLEEGYAVDNAYDGEEAEYMAETTPFDIIVLDIMLPKKDGVAAPAPAEPQPVSSDAERTRRQQEQQFILRGLLRQGVLAEQKGNTEAACWNYRKVLESDKDNRQALVRLGLIEAERGNDEDAERYLHRAFRLDPDDVDALLHLGFTLVREKKADLAISMLTRAVALNPDNPAIHRSLGVACSSLGWLDAAEVQFRRAFGLDPRDRESAFNMAILLASRKPVRMEEARDWYRKARDLGSASDPGLDELFKTR